MTLTFCMICEENLKKYSLALNVWQFITQEYFIDGFFEIMDYDESLPIVKFLESKGYLITVESGIESLLIKPVGVHFKISDDNEYEEEAFCFCRNGTKPHEEIVF